MMKITHFGKYYFPDSGGIESVTLSLANGAAGVGYDVTVVCFKKAVEEINEKLGGVNILRAPIQKMIASQPLGVKYFFYCIKFGRKSELIHLHAPNMLAAFCALFIRGQTKLLVHWHSDIINKGFLGGLFKPLERALLKRADVIVATSGVYADASDVLLPFREKVVVVPLGVPDAKKSLANQVANESSVDLYERIAGRKIILAVGRLVPYKGFDVLVEAAKYLDDDTIVVVVGGGALQDELNAKIKISGVSDRVLLTGRLSDSVLHFLFERAAIYCLPSTYRAEAFGVVLLEAMAYGLPIVATDIPGSGVPWVNKHGVSGLNVPVGDAIALAQACKQILNSDEIYNKFSAGARNRFLSEFTENLFVMRMLAVYDRIVGSGSERVHEGRSQT